MANPAVSRSWIHPAQSIARRFISGGGPAGKNAADPVSLRATQGAEARARTTPTSTPKGRSRPAPAGYTPPAMPENQLRFTGLSRRFGRLAVLAGVSGEVAD